MPQWGRQKEAHQIFLNAQPERSKAFSVILGWLSHYSRLTELISR